MNNDSNHERDRIKLELAHLSDPQTDWPYGHRFKRVGEESRCFCGFTISPNHQKEKEMSKFRKHNKAQEDKPKTPVSESSTETTETDVNQTVVETFKEVSNNFADAAAKIEESGIDPIAPVEATTTKTRGVIPDQFGNNVKGERICKNCGIKESETLAKNPRYSFCKGLCVNCYGKLERKQVKPGELTVPQLEEKIAYYKDLLQKKLVGAQGLPEGNTIENTETNTANASIESHGANVGTQVEPTEQLAAIE
jgi:hypothetical protein